jgi:hypothetical protein
MRKAGALPDPRVITLELERLARDGRRGRRGEGSEQAILSSPAVAGKAPVALEITGSRGQVVMTSRAALSSFGGFGLDLELPADAALGDYHVAATLDGQVFRERFSVEEFRPASFELGLAPSAASRRSARVRPRRRAHRHRRRRHRPRHRARHRGPPRSRRRHPHPQLPRRLRRPGHHLHAGDFVTVQLTVTASTDHRWVALVDPLVERWRLEPSRNASRRASSRALPARGSASTRRASARCPATFAPSSRTRATRRR